MKEPKLARVDQGMLQSKIKFLYREYNVTWEPGGAT